MGLRDGGERVGLMIPGASGRLGLGQDVKISEEADIHQAVEGTGDDECLRKWRDFKVLLLLDRSAIRVGSRVKSSKVIWVFGCCRRVPPRPRHAASFVTTDSPGACGCGTSARGG